MNVIGHDDKFVETELLLSAVVFEGRKKKITEVMYLED